MYICVYYAFIDANSCHFCVNANNGGCVWALSLYLCVCVCVGVFVYAVLSISIYSYRCAGVCKRWRDWECLWPNVCTCVVSLFACPCIRLFLIWMRFQKFDTRFTILYTCLAMAHVYTPNNLPFYRVKRCIANIAFLLYMVIHTQRYFAIHNRLCPRKHKTVLLVYEMCLWPIFEFEFTHGTLAKIC